LWYLWLLPPVLPNLALSRNRAIALLVVWVLAQVSPGAIDIALLVRPLLIRAAALSFSPSPPPAPRRFGPQALWLLQAARLELAAQPVYREVWAAGIVFFGANCWVLGELVGAYRVGDGAADQAGAGDAVAREKPAETDKPK
jgi:phosphatidylinositol glycan class M